MNIGIAYDLKTSVEVLPGYPDDATEEYDPPETINFIVSEIEKLGHNVIHLGGGTEFLEKIHNTKVDIVFNISEGRGTFRSRESQVPCVLEMLGIPYTGSDPLTLALCLDKPFTKLVAKAENIATPSYYTISQDNLKTKDIGFPLVVKPSFEGSSKGIRATSLVYNEDELQRETERMLKAYRQPVLVEQFIAGTEVTVGIVGNHDMEVIGVLEIVPNDNKNNFMYTLEVKRDWEKLVSFRCPPQLPESCITQIKNMSLHLFKVFGCRDIARFDFRVDKDFCPYFIEANPLPGLSPIYSDLCILAKSSGWSYSKLIEKTLDSAFQRYQLHKVI